MRKGTEIKGIQLPFDVGFLDSLMGLILVLPLNMVWVLLVVPILLLRRRFRRRRLRDRLKRLDWDLLNAVYMKELTGEAPKGPKVLAGEAS